jgi:diguanylate cyclase (GGDEF)-like protein
MAALTIKSRLILVLSVILVVAFLSTSFINFHVSRESVREELVTSALPLTRDTIYSEIHQKLMRPIYISSLMANDAFLKDWVKGGEQGQEIITRYLLDISVKYGYFTTFFVSAQTMNYYHYNGVQKKVSRQAPHDKWYYDFVDSGLEYELNVDTNEAAAYTLTIFINYRVVDSKGELLGVTGVGLKMDTVAQLLKETQDRYNRRIFLMAPEGLIQAHSNPELIGQVNIRDLPGIGALSKEILSSGNAPADFQYQGEHGPTLLTVRFIPELDWFLVVEQDEESALAAARRNFIQTLGIGLIASLVIILICFLTVSHFQSKLEKIAVTDELTKASNRRAFGEHFARASARRARQGQPFSVLLMDLDKFKDVNDTLGHMEGDRVLKDLARVAREQIRPTDNLARWGGDEFVVLTECGAEEAQVVAERIRSEVEKTFSSLGDGETDSLSVTVSCGVAEYREGESLDDLMARVDKELYAAKNAGRNRVVCCG